VPHPSERIRSGRSRHLEGRTIVLGISGSIAAIESPRIARELIRHGAAVVAVMSREATRIVTAEAMGFATGRPAVSELSGDVEHVTLLGPGPGRADLYLIAPATANTLSKIAHGIDDTPVTTCASVALGGQVPMLVAPAMHAHMAENPAVRENLERLRGWGVGVVAPVASEGEEKLAPPETIAAAVVHRLANGPWAGRRLLVVGGATREPIDAVRSITNESSGETAIALATEAYYRGGEVTLWAGAMRREPPGFVALRSFRSVADLRRLAAAEIDALRSSDAILVPAALSDFGLPPSPGKIPSGGAAPLTLNLHRLPKVLPELRRLAGARPRLIGFKLEAGLEEGALAARASGLLEEAELDGVVANDASVLGSDRSEALFLDRRGARRWLRGTKAEVAAALLDAVAELLAPAGVTGPPKPHLRRASARRAPRRAGGSRSAVRRPASRVS
jgi:phosphopantothenoylcysteine decarboxylase / phosphopantothenate---cysteine ligase